MNRDAVFITVVPPVAILSLMVVYGHGPWGGWRIFGGGLALASLGLLTAARLHLGSSFSITAQARRLVTTGPYARIRHPVYVFSAPMILGLALYFALPWLAALLVFILPLQVLRARKEERVLRQAFGEAYEAYRKTTWF